MHKLQLRCIKVWMTTKNMFHTISAEGKMMRVWCHIQSLLKWPHTHYIGICRVLLVCRQSGCVSTTLTNVLQHLFLWTVGQSIGSTVTPSTKSKSSAYAYIFGDEFCYFWETHMLLLIRPRNLLRVMILESRKKVRRVAPGNQQLGRPRHALQVRMH